MIQSADDILQELQSLRVMSTNISSAPRAHPETIDIKEEIDEVGIRARIEAALGATPAAVDELVRQCQVSPAVLATILLDLEPAGRLERLPGNRVALVGMV